jgi:hypothetical protein
MIKQVPNGYYNQTFLQVEPMIAWFTNTELGIKIWTFKDIEVYPSFESYGPNYTNLRKLSLPSILIKANTPTVIKFGSLVDDFDDYLVGPPQTNVKVFLNAKHHCKCDTIFQLNYNIPKYWAGPIDPNIPDFDFNINSCNKVLGDYETVKELYPYDLQKVWSQYSEKVNLNILLGDNIYLSEYQADTETGVVQRYKKLYNQPFLSGSWSSTAFNAINDDHDLGVNDVSYGGPGLYLNRKIFAEMWPNNNLNNISPLIWSFFKYDLSFVGLDCRSFCTEPVNPTSTILGETQLKWLRQTLYSIKELNPNSFVFICTGIPFIRPREPYYDFGYLNDQNAIIAMIEEFDLKNVIFLTGSAHFSDISQREIGKGITITEFINSPMGTIPRDEEGYSKFPPNPYLVPGTLLLNENNFGNINVSGKDGERVLTYKVVKKDGSIAYEFVMNQKV